MFTNMTMVRTMTMLPGRAIVARELRITATFSTGETPTVPAAVVLATYVVATLFVQILRCHHVIRNFAQRTILSPLPPERSFATRPNWRRDGPSLKRLTYQIPSLEEKLCLKLLLCFWKINLDGKAPQASLDGEDTGSVGRNSPAISFPISWSAFGKGSAIALVGASEVFDPVVAGHCWHSLGNWQLRLDKWRPEESWRRDRTDRSGAKKRDETMRGEKKRLDDEKWRQKSDCCQSQESL